MTDDALRAAAIAATPGPWSAAVAHSQVSVITSTRRQLVCHGSGLHARQNCAYIAAASPDVVLALLERVRVAEAAAHDARKGADDGTGS